MFNLRDVVILVWDIFKCSKYNTITLKIIPFIVLFILKLLCWSHLGLFKVLEFSSVSSSLHISSKIAVTIFVKYTGIHISRRKMSASRERDYIFYRHKEYPARPIIQEATEVTLLRTHIKCSYTFSVLQDSFFHEYKLLFLMYGP